MGLYLLIPTFIVVIVSILVVRAGAVALRLTGLDERTANFQALSAFTRAGFTTRESEAVIGHPQRRRIISWLIILGNAGIVAVIVTGTSSLATSSSYNLIIDIVALIIGLYIIYRLVGRGRFSRGWERTIENRFLKGRFFGRVPVEHLLHLSEGYGVVRAAVIRDSWADRPLADVRLSGEGPSVLGIERGGDWLPRPQVSETIRKGDGLILYGKLREIESLLKEDISLETPTRP